MMKIFALISCIIIVVQEAYSNCVVTFEVSKPDYTVQFETEVTIQAEEANKCAALCHRNGCMHAKFNPNLRRCSFLKTDHVQCDNTKRYFQYTTENTVWLQCMSSKCGANLKLLWLPKTRAETIAETIGESKNLLVVGADYKEIIGKPMHSNRAINASAPLNSATSEVGDRRNKQAKQIDSKEAKPMDERAADLLVFGKPEYSQHGTTGSENLRTTKQNAARLMDMEPTVQRATIIPLTTDQPESTTSKDTTNSETTHYTDTVTNPGYADKTTNSGYPDKTTNPGLPDNTTNPGLPDKTTNPGLPDKTTNSGYPDKTTNPGLPDNTTNPGFPDNTINPGFPDNTINPGLPDNTTNPGFPDNTINPGFPDNTTNPGFPDNTINPGFPDNTTNPGFPDNTINPGFPDNTTNPGFPDNTINPGFPQNTTKPGYPDNATNPGFPDNTTKPGYPDNTSNPGYPDDTTNPSLGDPENTTYSGYPENTTYSGYPENTTYSGYPENTTYSGYPENTTYPDPTAHSEHVSHPEITRETTTYAEIPDSPASPSKIHLKGQSYPETKPKIKVHTETVSQPQTSTNGVVVPTSPEIISSSSLAIAMKEKFAGPFVCGLTFAISPLYTIDESLRFSTTRRTMSAAVCAGYCFLQACTRAAYDPMTKLCLISLDGPIPESCPIKFKTSIHVSNEQVWIECVQCDELFLTTVYREKGSAGLNAADRQQGNSLLKQRLKEPKLSKQLTINEQLEANAVNTCVIVFQIDQSIVTDKFTQVTVTLSTANCARRCYAMQCSHAVFEPTTGRCLMGFDGFSDKCSDEKLTAVHRTQHGVGIRCIQCVHDIRFRDIYGAEIVNKPIDWFSTTTQASVGSSIPGQAVHGCWFSFELIKPDGNMGEFVDHLSSQSAHGCVNLCYKKGCSKVSWSPNLEICLLSFQGPTASSRCSNTQRHEEYSGREMIAFQCIKLECGRKS